MIRETQPLPVSGKLHSLTIFERPFLSTCSVTTTTLVLAGLATKSMAPPIPLTIPGRAQLARSPNSDTCIAPRMVRSTRPDLIIANDSSEPNNEAPSIRVTVSLPALIKSGSSSPFNG
ncbi:hypothetical protein AWJ20_1148 [Sugiyamaella lignohabitans]|uniref:Uncharacterized protein n=1 Tax=Sugiyamaella lignohabitans TaxID=796027 RepID=A0A167DFU0_9ASCO|nr:uncharacterized protein AWJ20_1148 [Sugiyamaella lignohabitans]ANB12870.1 hypothetical protein AWJ20_1148 [Sugiyamaella lignohabitans]